MAILEGFFFIKHGHKPLGVRKWLTKNHLLDQCKLATSSFCPWFEFCLYGNVQLFIL